MTLGWDQHSIYYEDALAKFHRNAFDEAVESWNVALELRESGYARWNWAQARLSLGDYCAFRDDYLVRWDLYGLLNEQCKSIRARLPIWRGEDIRGKRLVVLHEQGFGDTLMLLRFVPQLQAIGIEVVLAVPPPLHRLAQQLAPLGEDGDLCCPTFDLLAHLQVTPQTVPHEPYLSVDPDLRAAWAGRLPHSGRQRIGITWRQGPCHPSDFFRSVPLDDFLRLLAAPDCDIFSLQKQGRGEARVRGVHVVELEDFADVVALASLMDEVVSIDTAAIHAVGATGHKNAAVLLPYSTNWKWLGTPSPWYPHVRRCQQLTASDWAHAFKMLDRRDVAPYAPCSLKAS